MVIPVKKKISYESDDDDFEDDEDMDLEDEDAPQKPKIVSKIREPIEELPEIKPRREVVQKRQQEVVEKEQPQVVQIPRVVSQEEMLNIIYDQQLQIINLLSKKDEQ